MTYVDFVANETVDAFLVRLGEADSLQSAAALLRSHRVRRVFTGLDGYPPVVRSEIATVPVGFLAPGTCLSAADVILVDERAFTFAPI